MWCQCSGPPQCSLLQQKEVLAKWFVSICYKATQALSM